MIKTFRNKETEALFHREPARRLPPELANVARRKLLMLQAANGIEDLRVPPGNHLEQLKGTRAGQQSLRINDQWRICFTWKDGHAYDVEIVDYH